VWCRLKQATGRQHVLGRRHVLIDSSDDYRLLWNRSTFFPLLYVLLWRSQHSSDVQKSSVRADAQRPVAARRSCFQCFCSFNSDFFLAGNTTVVAVQAQKTTILAQIWDNPALNYLFNCKNYNLNTIKIDIFTADFKTVFTIAVASLIILFSWSLYWSPK